MAEVGLAPEGTAAVGTPKVHVAIVLLELCVGLEWLREVPVWILTRCTRRKTNRIYVRPKRWY
jgi:hypothetical protein